MVKFSICIDQCKQGNYQRICLRGLTSSEGTCICQCKKQETRVAHQLCFSFSHTLRSWIFSYLKTCIPPNSSYDSRNLSQKDHRLGITHCHFQVKCLHMRITWEVLFTGAAIATPEEFWWKSFFKKPTSLQTHMSQEWDNDGQTGTSWCLFTWFTFS